MNYHKPFALVKLICMVMIWPLMMNMSACPKESYNKTLPPATQTGANTMGAYLDGVIWNPAHTGYGTGINCEESNQILNITGSRINSSSDAGFTRVFIKIYNYKGVGDYTLNNRQIPNFAPLNGNGAYNQGMVIVGNQGYLTDSAHVCKVTITYADSVRNIISGTFTFDAVNTAAPADIVHVTDGRFDFINPAKTIESVSW